ncbi:MAG: DUF2088 domain-containing protein [Bacteroidales bacterium]|nr:DUF2088 domain-containing protein [Candidatus Cacconaster equifaecalis]
MLYFAEGSKDRTISPEEVRRALNSVFDSLGKKKRVLAIPPDFTRFNSYAGPITEMVYDRFGTALTDIMPALGTHSPMTESQIERMFGHVPHNLFRVHDWRNDVVTVGEVPSEYVREISEGRVSYSWPAQVNRLLLDPSFDLILSIGQVVPHEVIGMANYTKNIFVGVGGADGINRSHYLGATYGMERIMGRADTPVRAVMEYAREHFIGSLPILYIQTVLAKNFSTGKMELKGLFIGDDSECFKLASRLSLETNFNMVERPIRKCVVYLDPEEFKSTWLGNKAIYRTRMALADGAELIIVAPALKEFGEDPAIDSLIRKYGYRGTPHTLKAVEENADLRDNLSAAAHLIHGSSEGRFTITYCPGSGMPRQEIESVGFGYGRYDISSLKEGWNVIDGEEVYYISNPALGLWAHPDRFKD